MAFKPKTATGGAGAARAGIDWILNPNIDFNETDTTAAEMALAGGVSGSQFAGINNLRLRDSERMNRITLGNQLLDPFLNREQATELEGSRQAGEDRRLAVSGQQAMDRLSQEQAGNLQLADREERSRLNQLAQEGAQAMARLQLTEGGETARQGAALAGQQQTVNTQIAAQSARDAIEQAGLDRRLSTTAANALQMAILNGDLNAQQQLLEEAGLDRRQAATIRANMDAARINSQNDLLRTLITAGGVGGRGGGGAGDGRVAPAGTNNVSTGAIGSGPSPQSGGFGILPYQTQNIFGSPQANNPSARGGSGSSGGGSTNRYTTYINQILRGYGLS